MDVNRGMSTAKARRVKLSGHEREQFFAKLIQGEVIKGTQKEDVQDQNGKLYSLKTGQEIKGAKGGDGKWQIFLYRKARFIKNDSFPGKDIFISILDVFPDSYSDYKSNKPLVNELTLFLQDTNNLNNFLDYSFFDCRVDFFVILDKNIFHIFSRKDILDVFIRNFEVCNNSTFQKTVFKYAQKIFGEIEVRTTNDGKYPSILFTISRKLQALNMFQRKIKTASFYQNSEYLYCYGSALNEFNPF